MSSDYTSKALNRVCELATHYSLKSMQISSGSYSELNGAQQRDACVLVELCVLEPQSHPAALPSGVLLPVMLGGC